MATTSETGAGGRDTTRYPAGQRLHCKSCGSEVEIINPCSCEPSDLDLRCCKQKMMPVMGKSVHLGVE